MEVIKEEFWVQCVIKTAFMSNLLIVAPSSCYYGKHEQGTEGDVLK